MGKYINLVHKTNSTYDEVYIKQNLPREILFNLSTGSWTVVTNGYQQIVNVNGITTNSTGVIGVSQTATSLQWQAAQNAKLRITSQGNGTVTITAYGVKPTVVIPCVITCSNNMKLLRNSGDASSDIVTGS